MSGWIGSSEDFGLGVIEREQDFGLIHVQGSLNSRDMANEASTKPSWSTLKGRRDIN